ncbi:hypothetical protein LCI18_011812 [Fusarium solani-melongenae]|uniref:Uncharacterized protein n=1 Tax=Fusarium solani subsp. cucurbitae TaxID=2747967 RepID=A0ACD3ZI14_FUSSC|nr:hypothetical protein LCI18_011812 [Fusarium solani-melongenae]
MQCPPVSASSHCQNKPLSLDSQTHENSSMTNVTSTFSDAKQQKSRQSSSPPRSQATTISLRDGEAHSALVESKDDTIWISSDSDTEDEDEEGQVVNDSQSSTTTATTITSHSDTTSIKQTPPGSEAAVGTDTTPAVSPVWIEDNPNMDPTADPGLNQQSPCQSNRSSVSRFSASIDASLNLSPASPEYQPYLAVSDQQQLVTEFTKPASELGITAINALSDEDSCRGGWSTLAFPSMSSHSTVTTTSGEMAQALLHSSEVCMVTSPDDAAPEARNSPLAARLSPGSHRGQHLDNASCRSSDAESEAADGGCRSPFEAQASPQLPSLRRSRRKSPHAHTTAQEEGSDADTESSGSEDGLDVPEYACDEDYCPSLPEVQGSDSEDHAFDDEEHQDYKRRKVSMSPSCLRRNAATNAGDFRQRRRSTRAIAHSLRESDRSALGVLSPAQSRARSIPSEASAILARFQEWPLENVLMKCITENGKTTFQFQFEWPLCTDHPHVTSVIPDSTRSFTTRKTAKRAPARRAKYSDDEDNFLIQLKEEENLGWAEIRQRFAQRFPERGGSSLQVHYCTKLKYRRT